MAMNWLNLAIEISGWAGALLIFGAYLLVSAGRLSGRSVAYQAMNVVGSAGFVINSGWHGAVPSMVLNAVWLVVGLATLASLRRGRG